MFSAQIVHAFVYDDFSGNEVDSIRWDLSCLGGCSSETRITNDTFRLLGKTDGSYIYLKGFRFTPDDILEFDFVYVNGAIGFQYGGYPPYPSFFPDNNRLPYAGKYHMKVQFLENREVEWFVQGVSDFNQSGNFSYGEETPIFYPSVGHGEMYLDNFTITSSKRIPYRIEITELPIYGYSPSTPENKPQFYRNDIVYISGYNEKSIYSVMTNQTDKVSYEFALPTNKTTEEYSVERMAYRLGLEEKYKWVVRINNQTIDIPDGFYEWDGDAGSIGLCNSPVYKSESGIWAVRTGGGGIICYFDIDSGVFVYQGTDPYVFDYYDNRIVFFTPKQSVYGQGYLGSVKYVNGDALENFCEINDKCNVYATTSQAAVSPSEELPAISDAPLNPTQYPISPVSKSQDTILLPLILGLVIVGGLGFGGYKLWKSNQIDTQRDALEKRKEGARLRRQQLEEEAKRKTAERQRMRYEKGLQKFERDLIGKKKASPFQIRDLYLNSFVRKHGLGKKDDIDKLNEILQSRHIKLDKPLEDSIHGYFEREQKRKGLEKFVDSDENEKWGTSDQIKKWKEIDLGLSDNFASIHWMEFEKLMGKLFEKMGYRNIRVTKATGDYGIDIIAKRRNRVVAVQCKKWRDGVVSNKDIQGAIGAASYYRAKKLIFITTARFTREAIEQAEGSSLEVELWDKDNLKDVIRKYMID